MNDNAAVPAPSDAEVLAALTALPPAVPPNTYELALVMGGTVSAGAYTAGAVDFLIEALDCFAAAKAAQGATYHDVSLKVLCGTSGGAVTAAIMARALNYKFPSQYNGAPAPAEGAAVNPLYKVWVELLDLQPMLATNDIGETVPSLLNVAPIDAGIDFVVNYTAPPQQRAWVGAPLTVILTHTNLSGIPYHIDFGGGQSQTYVDHADYAQFAVRYPWQQNLPQAKPYEFTLAFGGAPGDATWGDFGQFAAASAAFPLGFTTRPLQRPLAHYHYRVFCTANPPRSADDLHIFQPDWAAVEQNNGLPDHDGMVHYSTADGGVVDNEPIQLARTALTGLLGQNPRNSARANRSVWLIDPFAGEADMSGYNMASFIDGGSAALNAALQQCRYSTADLVLALLPNVYSRFMLAAARDGKSGGPALATAGLDAFMGFACQAYRAHDYYLGRQNCQTFLREQFRQTADNPVFAAWTPAQKALFIDPDGDLPIIPLFGRVAAAETVPPWPAGAFDPATIKDKIEARLQAVLDAEILPHNVFGKILGGVAGGIPAGFAANAAVKAMQSALQQWALL